MLAGFGYPLKREGQRVCLRGGGQLQARSIEVPADISSAAFFMVGACIAKGSEILQEHVGINPTRTGINVATSFPNFIDLAHQAGIDIKIDQE